jgi:serine/threonine protein kinase
MGGDFEPADVKEGKKEWHVEDPDYRPVTFTAPSVLEDPTADPGFISLLRPGTVLFNQLDKTSTPPVDRRSHVGKYEVEGGAPRFPHGRTGISGRGNLRRWGPNHEVMPIISTWKVSEAGAPIPEDPVLFILCLSEDIQGKPKLMSAPVTDGADFARAAYGFIADCALGTSLASVKDRDAVIDEQLAPLLGAAVANELYKGIANDPRVTDNAWVEVVATNFHLPSDAASRFSAENIVRHTDFPIVWVPATDAVRFSPQDRVLVELLVAEVMASSPPPPPASAASAVGDDEYIVAGDDEPEAPELRAEATLASAAVNFEAGVDLPATAPVVVMDEPTFQPEERRVSSVSSQNFSSSSLGGGSEVSFAGLTTGGGPEHLEEETMKALATHVLGTHPADDIPMERGDTVPADRPHAPAPDVNIGEVHDSDEENQEQQHDGVQSTPAGVAEASTDSETARRASLAVQRERFVNDASFNQAEATSSATGLENMRHAKDGEIKVEIVYYLGKVEATSNLATKQASKEEVIRCVKVLKAKGGGAVKQPVRLVIGAEGIDVDELPTFEGEPKKKAKRNWSSPELLDTKSKTIKSVPIRHIAYTGTDPKQKKIFCFIATDPRTKASHCHVFESKVQGRHLAAAVMDAFKQAVKIRDDPFALRREVEVTPDAAGMANVFAAHQIDRRALKAKIVIGHGQYGKVYLADFAHGSEVKKAAVKLMRPELSHVNGKDFLTEAHSMLRFNHPKLLTLIGVAIEKKPWLIVVNFMHYKDLGIVLRQCRKNDVLLRSHEMLTLCEQMADGMVYMSDLRYIHRDLAARNIMLTHKNAVKIGDFGLARMLPEGKDYWRLDKAGRLPVKYMAAETLTSKRFSVASDVWAFGVCMWEVMAYGETPWARQKVANVDVKNAVSHGKRLIKPPMYLYAPQDVSPEAEVQLDEGPEVTELWDWWYSLLLECWDATPKDRPSFQFLKAELGKKFAAESARLPAMRDVGKACYLALEAAKKMKGRGRGGSIIRAAETTARKKKAVVAEPIVEEDEPEVAVQENAPQPLQPASSDEPTLSPPPPADAEVVEQLQPKSPESALPPAEAVVVEQPTSPETALSLPPAPASPSADVESVDQPTSPDGPVFSPPPPPTNVYRTREEELGLEKATVKKSQSRLDNLEFNFAFN